MKSYWLLSDEVEEDALWCGKNCRRRHLSNRKCVGSIAFSCLFNRLLKPKTGFFLLCATRRKCCCLLNNHIHFPALHPGNFWFWPGLRTGNENSLRSHNNSLPSSIFDFVLQTKSYLQVKKGSYFLHFFFIIYYPSILIGFFKKGLTFDNLKIAHTQKRRRTTIWGFSVSKNQSIR